MSRTTRSRGLARTGVVISERLPSSTRSKKKSSARTSEVDAEMGNTEEGQSAQSTQLTKELLARLDQQSALIATLQQQQQQQQQQQPAPSPSQSPLPSPGASPQGSPRMTAAASSSRFAKKEPRAQDLREYDGAMGTKLDEWLQELAMAVHLFQLNGIEASTFGISRLRGAAMQWWLALSASEQSALCDQTSLAAALRARFQPITTARVAREQLDRLQQNGRAVNDYIADFQRIHAQLPSMAEEDALHAFERGLRRDLAEQLRLQNVTTVRDAISLAARVGSIRKEAPSASSSSQGRTVSANQMEIDYDGNASLDQRIERAVLNAMQSQRPSNAGTPGVGAKTQTQRGYQQQRGGRGGKAGGQRLPMQPPQIPGVPDDVIQQRWADKQCLRCGAHDHRSMGCPNGVSAARSSGFSSSSSMMGN